MGGTLLRPRHLITPWQLLNVSVWRRIALDGHRVGIEIVLPDFLPIMLIVIWP
ncbi:MAG TPA: hypothetical protein VFF64_17120 [Candidatus Eremiobacteraceae bacterium]|nr:hypothetical protein [Candidatus Eremiobacteraceae bacterium]